MLPYDTMLSVVHHIDSVRHLGLFSCTSKSTHAFITANWRIWERVGQKLCGDWQPLGDRDQHCIRSRICPWMTEPRQIEVGLLSSIYTFGGQYRFKSIRVTDDDVCEITAAFWPSGFFAPGPVEQIVARTDAYGKTQRFDSVERIPDHWHMRMPSEAEITLLDDLKRTQWRPSALYRSSLISVRIVHDGLFCAFAPEDDGHHKNMVMYFVSAKTRLVLHTHR